jgi:outer membrane immunogenic protein
MKKFLLTTAAFGMLALPAMAADVAPVYNAPIPVPVYNAPIPVPVCIWCGFYLGLNAGGTWSDNNSVAVNSVLTQDFPPGPASYGAASAAGAAGSVPVGGALGFIVGGQIGYNWQVSSAWLVGLETDISDIQGVSGQGSGTLTNSVGPLTFFDSQEVVTTSIASTSKLDYLGTVRGRLGYLTPTFLLYGTAGLAYGGVKASTAITQSNNDCVFSPAGCLQSSTSAAGAFSQMRAGWTAGAGLEWMFVQKWSAKVEYLHYDLGSVTFSNGALRTSGAAVAIGLAVVGSTSSAKFSGDIVRAGVNYHW